MEQRRDRGPSVVTLGEGLIRLYPEPGETLEGAAAWRVSVGGAEANVAVALAQLGVPAAWLSKLPRNPLGRRIVTTLRGAGVDVSTVVWTDQGRVGLYLTETGITPEDLRVWYDRGHSSFFSLTPDEIDAAVLARYTLMHLTGITPALGEGPRATVASAVEKAVAAGVKISFDVNFRSRLWTAPEARQALLRLFQGRVHLVICSSRDAREVFGCTSDDEAIRWLRENLGAEAVLLTRGAQGALGWDGRELFTAEAYSGQIVDRIGRGDAFAAGAIAGYLAGDVQRGLRQGCALAALAQARWGDPLCFFPDQLDALILNGPGDRR